MQAYARNNNLYPPALPNIYIVVSNFTLASRRLEFREKLSAAERKEFKFKPVYTDYLSLACILPG